MLKSPAAAPAAWSMVLVTVALLLSGCTRDAPGRDVLFITVDTLRADHVGLYGYERPTTPNLDRWFGNATVYAHSYSTEANTSPSVVSLLSGRLLQEHGVRLFFQLAKPDLTLVTDLLPAEYQRAAFVSNIVLTNEAIGLASDFDHYDDFVDQPEPHRKVYERNAQRTTDAVLRWLAASRDLARPLFLWVHYIDPHGPYHPPDSWPRSFTHAEPRPINVANILEYQREPGLTDGLEYVDRYDEEVAYVDHEIGRLIDGYAERHRADEALIVFTADHGESMMEHQRWFTHGYHVYEEIARVPLMVRGPGVTVRRFEEPVSGVDVAPTILRFVGRAVPEWMSAVDLRSGKGLDGTREVFIEATVGPEQQWRAVVQGRRKWMVSVRSFGPVPSAQRVYDLAADPRELTPRPWEALAEPARHLLELCRTDPDPAGVPRQYAKGIQLSAPKVAPGLPAETRARLKALGYAE